MRVAIVHDYIKEYGGAERVLEALHKIFPDAPVFTTVYLPKFLGLHQARFKDWDIRTSWLQYIPFKEKLISPFRIISPYIFKSFDFSGFDIVIVSQTGAYFPNTINKDKAKLICYTHTPPRYLYGYKTARQWKNNLILRILGEIANHYLRIVDFNASRNVDYFIANSKEVQARIKKFYRKEAVVIYPPAVNNKLSNFSFDPEVLRTEGQIPISNKNTKSIISNSKLTGKWKLATGKYYLTGGRLARAKGTDIIVEAFSRLDKTLLVFGRGFAGFDPTSLKLRGARKNIEYLGEVTDEEKFTLMRKAKAYIFASFDEDFGITPVEAMSVGTPVIAYRSGGVKETVIDPSAGSGQATGIFYDENTPDCICEAVKKFEKISIKPKDCINQSIKFSEDRFKNAIKDFIKKSM